MYSYLPVMDEAGVILGLYRAEKWLEKEALDQPICADFEPLSEDLVMGADATIIEFLRTADDRRSLSCQGIEWLAWLACRTCRSFRCARRSSH